MYINIYLIIHNYVIIYIYIYMYKYIYVIIVRALWALPDLEDLKLGQNGIGDEGAFECFSKNTK